MIKHTKYNICKTLVGNNCDLSNRVVTENEGKKLANDFKISFFEVSTRTKQNIKEVFNCMILEMINNAENNIKKKLKLMFGCLIFKGY